MYFKLLEDQEGRSDHLTIHLVPASFGQPQPQLPFHFTQTTGQSLTLLLNDIQKPLTSL